MIAPPTSSRTRLLFVAGLAALLGLVAVAGIPAAPSERQPGELFVASDGSDGTWSHLAATYDGTTLRLYVNAVEVSRRPVSGTLDSGAGPLRIGGNSVWGEWFHGAIDEVRVYSRALGPDEIRRDAASPVAPAPGLVAGYSFGEGSGTVVHDLSGNANDGTIDGATWVRDDSSRDDDDAGIRRRRFGNALSFDGIDDSIRIPDAASLDLSTQMTLEAWVRPDRLIDWRTVILKEQPSNLAYALYANTGAEGPSANVVIGGSESIDVGPAQLPLNSCARATPCQTFDHAYRAAQPGQTVTIAGGSYPLQTIAVDAAKSSPDNVVFRAAKRKSVTVRGLDVLGNHVTFRDFAVEGDWTTHTGTDDVTFLNLDVHGGIFTQSSSNIHVIGGSVGGIQDYKPQIGSWPPGTENRNIVIDGVRFHDITRTNSSVHIECLLVGGVDGLVIRNSRFENCDVFDVSIAELNGSPPVQNVLIENNFFDGANGFYSLFFNDESTSLSNVLVRYNSSPQEMYFAYGTPVLNNVSVIANIAPTIQWHCDSRITYAYNVWQGAQCGATDLNAAAGFRNAATGDLHLLPGAPAINHGDPFSFPVDDIDGQHRPLGPAVDAGADEVG